jgi:SAM-dependent methyltransferase
MDAKDWDKVAESYHEDIISPFYGKVDNPLFEELKKIESKGKKRVAEFGCGLFYLGKRLAKDFKNVYACDFSEKMIECARERHKGYENIEIRKEDLRKIKHTACFDTVIAVNSIIMPSAKEVKRCFSNIHKSLKKGGRCLLILPSMESVLYNGMLMLHKELKGKKESSAITAAKRRFENKKYDFFRGLYIDGRDKQKFYYEHEIRYLMKEAGFKDVEVRKVLYPWGKDVSDYEDFPKEEKLWDWFVKAKKSFK